MNIFARILFSFQLLAAAALFGDLEEHLKPVTHKSGAHSMRNIDFIYMINLDQRPEKWKKSIEQLAPFGIFPCRFSAVNGWELSLEAINDVGLKYSPGMEGAFMATSYHLDGNYEPSHELLLNYGQTYFCHCMARGTIGIALSHISILQDAYDSEYQTIWVMEDDIDVRQDPRILSDLIEKLDALVGKENWDILFTDRDIRDGNGKHSVTYWAAKRPDFVSRNDFFARQDISPEFRTIGARYGAHSMILRRKGIEKLLRFFNAHSIFLPYDMDYILPHGIRLFTVREDIVSNTPKAISDNGGPNYLKKQD